MRAMLAKDDLLWLLGSLSQLYRQPFDAALIAQSYPPPASLVTFHEAARTLGFKTGACPVAGIDWASLPLPAIAFLRNSEANPSPATAVEPTAEPSLVESCIPSCPETCSEQSTEPASAPAHPPRQSRRRAHPLFPTRCPNPGNHSHRRSHHPTRTRTCPGFP